MSGERAHHPLVSIGNFLGWRPRRAPQPVDSTPLATEPDTRREARRLSIVDGGIGNDRVTVREPYPSGHVTSTPPASPTVPGDAGSDLPPIDRVLLDAVDTICHLTQMVLLVRQELDHYDDRGHSWQYDTLDSIRRIVGY